MILWPAQRWLILHVARGPITQRLVELAMRTGRPAPSGPGPRYTQKG